MFFFSFSVGAGGKFITFYLLGMFIPYLYALYLIWAVFEMFTPILGRSGSEIPPDVVLASILAGCTLILSSYFVRKNICIFKFPSSFYIYDDFHHGRSYEIVLVIFLSKRSGEWPYILWVQYGKKV